MVLSPAVGHIAGSYSRGIVRRGRDANGSPESKWWPEGLQVRKPFTSRWTRSVMNREGETARVEGRLLRRLDRWSLLSYSVWLSVQLYDEPACRTYQRGIRCGLYNDRATQLFPCAWRRLWTACFCGRGLCYCGAVQYQGWGGHTCSVTPGTEEVRSSVCEETSEWLGAVVRVATSARPRGRRTAVTDDWAPASVSVRETSFGHP
jgi:hypothetical protein